MNSMKFLSIFFIVLLSATSTASAGSFQLNAGIKPSSFNAQTINTTYQLINRVSTLHSDLEANKQAGDHSNRRSDELVSLQSQGRVA